MKKQFYLIPALLILLFLWMTPLLLTAQTVDPNFAKKLAGLYRGGVSLILSKELDTKIRNGEQMVILDTREPDEYQISHLNNSIFTGYKKFNFNILKSIPKDHLIILYCSVGVRSERIGEKLIKMGYSNVYNLYGGIFEWINQGYPVYNQKGPTDQIHGYTKKWSRWLIKGIVVYSGE